MESDVVGFKFTIWVCENSLEEFPPPKSEWSAGVGTDVHSPLIVVVGVEVVPQHNGAFKEARKVTNAKGGYPFGDH